MRESLSNMQVVAGEIETLGERERELLLSETGVFQKIASDNVASRVEDDIDVLRIGGTRKVTIEWLTRLVVDSVELVADVARRFRI